jgi:hypothetical protein
VITNKNIKNKQKGKGKNNVSANQKRACVRGYSHR